MHREFRRLLDDATGVSQHIMALNIDIRGFTPFCQTVDSLEVATYIKKIYAKIIDNYFSDATYYKPTGDGLLVIINYEEKDLKNIANVVIDKCLNIIDNFKYLCKDDPMVNYPTPENIGIGISRGSACCISSNGIILDYSGKVLNLASRLMNVARPSGIVIDNSFGIDLLEKELTEQFSEDDIYIRGIAEIESIHIFFSKNHVLISDSFKKPLREINWTRIASSYKYIDFKKFSNLNIELEGKPIDEDEIQIMLGTTLIRDGEILNGFLEFKRLKIGDYDISCVKEGKKNFVRLPADYWIKKYDEYGLTDEMKILIEIVYQKK